jgi:hypothetical protein
MRGLVTDGSSSDFQVGNVALQLARFALLTLDFTNAPFKVRRPRGAEIR